MKKKNNLEKNRKQLIEIFQSDIRDKNNKIILAKEDATQRLKDANNYADQQIQIIPKEYECFYFTHQDGYLASFLYQLNIDKKGSGLGGYAMRADSLNEVDYRWCINPRITEQTDIELAINLSLLMELDLDKYAVTPPQGFHPTNWPKDSLIHYYKKFQKDEKRKNKPQEPEKPRTAHNFFSGKQEYKLDDASYRVWKKGTSFEGEKLEKSKDDRQYAGSVMAEALNSFDFYQNMIDKPKVTEKKLPATAFAKYVVDNDTTAKEQWKKDNNLEQNSINSMDVEPSVTTDQEWCHLFGHGDGGGEEFGNFVSGSKHCNTEQLAIEIGQRRISHSQDFKGNQLKLTAKITAYLMPNQGDCIKDVTLDKITESYNESNKQTSLTIDCTKKLLISSLDIMNKNKEQKTMSNEETTNNIEKLIGNLENKDHEFSKDEIKLLFEALSIAIRDKNNNSRSDLFLIRRTLENNCFIYLPLARWMRYKIYVGGKKVFDHIYDAQSQSIDYNECQILDYAVQQAIYREMNQGDNYKNKIQERVNLLKRSENEMKIIQKLLLCLHELSKNINNKKKNEAKKSLEQAKKLTNNIDSQDTPYSQPFIEVCKNIKAELDKINKAEAKIRNRKRISKIFNSKIFKQLNLDYTEINKKIKIT